MIGLVVNRTSCAVAGWSDEILVFMFYFIQIIFFSTSFYNSFTDLSADSNSPPKANAGGDHTVELPVDVLVLNGSQSWDDLAIAKWLWTREPTSLAIGSIIAGTDTSPVLMVSLCFTLIWYFCYIMYKCDTCVTTHSF